MRGVGQTVGALSMMIPGSTTDLVVIVRSHSDEAIQTCSDGFLIASLATTIQPQLILLAAFDGAGRQPRDDLALGEHREQQHRKCHDQCGRRERTPAQLVE